MSSAPVTQPSRSALRILSDHRPAESSSFGRQLAVEFRKLVDTRASRILLLVGALATIGIMALNLSVGVWMEKNQPTLVQGPMGLMDMVSGALQVMSLFVVLIGVMSVTSEWSQRTTLTTFALEPRRARVLAAKVAVVAIACIGLLAIAFPVGALCLVIAKSMGATVAWAVSWKALGGLVLAGLLSAAMGLAFGLVTLNTPAAIVIYFVLPTFLGIVGSLGMLWESLAKVMPWINPSTVTMTLISGEMTGSDWAHLLVSNLIWVALPFAIGTWRWMRREAK